MNLGVAERLVLLALFPKEGDLTTIRIVHELKQTLSFTEQEHKELNFRTEDDQAFWDNDVQKEIPIGVKARVLIGQLLEKLSDENLITEAHLPLWERFVEDSKIKAV